MSLSKDTQNNYLLSLIKEITVLNNKIQIIQILVNELAKSHDAELVKILKSQGFRFAYNPDDPEQYIKDLKMTVSQSKIHVLKIKDAETNLAKLSEGNKGGVNANEYDILLSELSKFQGYRLDPKLITVSEFIAIVNRFKAENKANKAA